MSKLPLVLDADEGSDAFVLQTDVQPQDPFELALRDGRINAVEVENARGEISVFSLPELHRAQHNAMTNVGPDIPKTTP